MPLYTGIYRYFDVYKEKVVVFVCPLTDSSQNMMTQLLSIVKGTGKSSTVEISSYFQKSPQNKQTTSLSSGQEKQPESSKPKSSPNFQSDPKDKIKNIIKRSGPKLSKKRKLPKTKKNVDPPEELCDNEQSEFTNSLDRNDGLSRKKRVLDDGDSDLFTRKKFQKTNEDDNDDDDDGDDGDEDCGQTNPSKIAQKKINDVAGDQNIVDRGQEAAVLLSSKQIFQEEIPKDSCSNEGDDGSVDIKKIDRKTRKCSKIIKKNPTQETRELKPESQLEVKSSITRDTDSLSTFKSKNESKALNSETESISATNCEASRDIITKNQSEETSSLKFGNCELKMKEKTQRENSKKEIYVNDFSCELPDIDFPIPEIKFTVTSASNTTNMALTVPGDFDLPKIKIGERMTTKLSRNGGKSVEDANEVEKNVKNNYQRLLSVCQNNNKIYKVELPDSVNEDFIRGHKDDENSDSPDSSTPNLVKTKTRLRCPRLSTIYPVIETSKYSEDTEELPVLMTKLIELKSTLTTNISEKNTKILDHSDRENLRIDNPKICKVKTQKQEFTSTSTGEKIFSSDSTSTDDDTNATSVKWKRKTKTILTEFSDNSVNEFKLSKPVLPVLISKRKRKQPETKPATTKRNVKSQNTNNYNFFSSSSLNCKKTDKSILDFFRKSKSSVVKAMNPSDFESNGHQTDESFDILLIEELSDYPKKIKDESTLAIQEEISRIDDVSLLNREQIRTIIFKLEDYLRDIFQGKVVCERHEDYKKGGVKRHNLNYQVNLSLFTDEQHDVVMETLMEMFCKRHHKYLDYLLKVLLPEILIKIHMEVNGTSREETEMIMKIA